MRTLLKLAVYVAACALPMTATAETPDQLYARGYAAANNGDRATCVTALQEYLLSVPTISASGRKLIESQITLCRGKSFTAQTALSRKVDIHGHTIQDLIRKSESMTHTVE